MKLSPWSITPLLVAVFMGCGESAQVAEDAKDGTSAAGDETADAAEEVADETEDAAEEVADETEDAAEEVADEADEAAQDTDAALDCAAVCGAQKDCASGVDEDTCYDNCDDVTIDGESNQSEQDALDECDDCVDAADEDVCDADGVFVCEEQCAAFISASDQ